MSFHTKMLFFSWNIKQKSSGNFKTQKMAKKINTINRLNFKRANATGLVNKSYF